MFWCRCQGKPFLKHSERVSSLRCTPCAAAALLCAKLLLIECHASWQGCMHAPFLVLDESPSADRACCAACCCVQLPAGSAIAASQQSKAAAEAAERAEMKRLVLHSTAVEAQAGASSASGQPLPQPIKQPGVWMPRPVPQEPKRGGRGARSGALGTGRGQGRRYSSQGS